MENTEPYPGSHLPQKQSSSPPGKKKPRKRFWLRHLIIAGFLFCAWTALGLPFALGNTRMDMIIDAVGWLICCLYLAFALVAGLMTGLAALVRRMLTSLHSPNVMP